MCAQVRPFQRGGARLVARAQQCGQQAILAAEQGSAGRQAGEPGGEQIGGGGGGPREQRDAAVARPVGGRATCKKTPQRREIARRGRFRRSVDRYAKLREQLLPQRRPEFCGLGQAEAR